MPGPHYHFITRWRVEGKAADAYEILNDPLSYPRWWKRPRLEVQELAPADGDGLNQTVEFKMKAFYALRWQSRSVETREPYCFSFESTGDFVGRGSWTFRQEGDFVDIMFDWNISAEKPLLRAFSFLLRPLFSANHNRIMARWEESLRAEMKRRSFTGTPFSEERKLPS